MNIRAKLSVLTIVPLAVLALLLGSFALLQANVKTADQIIVDANAAVSSYDDLLSTLIDAETGMRGFVITGIAGFLDPYRTAMTSFEPEIARIRDVGSADAAERKRIEDFVVLARSALAVDTRLTQLASGGAEARKAARALVAAGNGKVEMDRFRTAEAALTSSAVNRRTAGLRRLDLAWHRTYALFALAVFIGFATSLSLYVTISRNIFRRLRQHADALAAIAEGIPPDPIAPRNDEFAVLERSIRKMIELAQLREASLNRYKVLSDHARDIMFWTDEHDRVVEANAAALQAYGYTRDEMLGLRSAALVSPKSLPALPEKLRLVEAQGAALFEIDNVRKNGEEFPAEMGINSSHIDGAPVNFIVVRDITERRHASEALTTAYENAVESSRLKSQFVATMSHEIRTPMNGVIGTNELLLGTTLTDEQREYTQTVRDSSLALLGIIDDILDFSKIEAGRLDLDIVEMNVCDVVEAAAALLAPEAQRKGISLMTFVPPDLSRTVLGDGMRLRQILVNLIGNAVKFTEAGGVVVTVDLREETRTSLTLHFTVSDSGVGFDAATAAVIFEPFRQADGSTTRKFGGTGLGLSISRRLVELMDGELSATSRPGIGSEFSFCIQFSRVKNDTLPQFTKLAGSRALIVDDDSTTRSIFSRYMKAWGMEAGAAADVPTALEMLRDAAKAKAPYDIALIDHSLGALTGFDLTTNIKADPAIAGTHLVMITAYDGSKLGEASIAAGFSCYLNKPVRQAQLYDCIAKRGCASERPVVEKRAEEARPAASEGGEYRPERILLVEDQPVNRRLALQQLKKLGFAAQAVVNGQEAVNAVYRERYDVILMDCQMPVMDGFTATRVIRKSEAHTGRRIPIVAMTANARREDRDECIATGMDDYLAKPVQMEQLRGMLESWLAAGPAA